MKVDFNMNIKKYSRIAIMVIIVLMIELCSYTDCSVAAFSDDIKTDINLNCSGALLVEQKTGYALYGRNINKKMAPASLTKMMTCILVFENLNPDERVTITKEATGIGGNNIGLKPGEVLTVRELTNAMMIYSANDAAVALAIQVSKSVDKFCKLMNKKAKSIGCTDTHYISPNGLTDDRNHITTPRDQSKVARYLMKKQGAEEIVSRTGYTVPATNLSAPRKLKSTDEMLPGGKHEYRGIRGIKTGFMPSAGYCFVGLAKRANTSFIAVVMGAPDGNKRFQDCGRLLDYGFENYETARIFAPGYQTGRVKVRCGNKTFVKTFAPDGAYAVISKGQGITGDENVRHEIKMFDNIKAPIKKGTKVGELVVYKNKEVMQVSDILISESVKKGGPWSSLYISDRMFIALAVSALISIRLIIKKRSRAGRR